MLADKIWKFLSWLFLGVACSFTFYVSTRFGVELVSLAVFCSLFGSVLVALVGGVVAVGVTKIPNSSNRYYPLVIGIVWCISDFLGGAASAVVTTTLVSRGDLSLVAADLNPPSEEVCKFDRHTCLGSGLAGFSFAVTCALAAIPGAFLGGEMGRRSYIRVASRQSDTR